MSKIFISHSHRDNPSALAIAHWLTENGWSEFFLDVAADRGIAPGDRWQEALKQAAHRCEAVLFLISDAWLESRWCQAEFLLAKQLGKAIFGVLITTTPPENLPPEMRGEWQLCDLVRGGERTSIDVEMDAVVPRTTVSFASAGLGRLRFGLERAGLDASTFPWPPASDANRPPYSGLRAYDVEDAPVFFGRDAAITLALDALRRLRESSAERFFVILGASGAGKSSFLRAGLLPRLRRNNRSFFVAPVIRPERAAINGPSGLVVSLEGAFRQVSLPMNRSVVRKALEAPAGFVTLLAQIQAVALARLASPGTPPPAIVFAIDQAEELFTSEYRAEAEQLLHLFSGAMLRPEPAAVDDRPPDVFVLAAIRSDSYERLQTEPILTTIKQHVFSLQPIARDEYKTIIEGPAARHQAAGNRLRVDPRLTKRLLEDTQGADALPLLAFTLERLFLEHGGDGELTLDDYNDLGGVDGSIEAAVAAAFTDPRRQPEVPADETVRNRLLREGFLPWLAGVDPETEERKRRVATWAEIPEASRPVLERLIEQRLLIRDRRVLAGSLEDTIVVEVAHEALLRRWPLLTGWLDQDAEALKAIDGAKRAASEWVKNGRRDAWLNHSRERLSRVEALLGRNDLDRLLGNDGRVYVRACRTREDDAATAARTREVEDQERQRRLQEAEQAAERERLRLAEAEAQAATERANAARRLSRRTMAAAALLAVAMGVTAWYALSATEERKAAEHALGTLNVSEATRRQASGLLPESVAHLAQAVRLDNNDAVWRASLISALINNPWSRVTADITTIDPATAAVFSPDEQTVLVVAGEEARLWSGASGSRIGAPMRHRNTILDARFSRDGKLIVTASRDRTVRVWDAHTGQPKGDSIRRDLAVTRAIFSPGGTRIVTTAGDTIRVLDVGANSEDARQPSSGGWSIAAAGATGAFLVVHRGTDTRLWNVDRAATVGVSIPGEPKRVAFAGRDAFVAVATTTAIHVVDTRTGSLVGPPVAVQNGEPFVRLALTNDGGALAVWRLNGAAVFETRTGNAIVRSIRSPGHLSDVYVLPEARRVITVSEAEGRSGSHTQLWNMDTGENLPLPAGVVSGHTDRCPGGDIVLSSSTTTVTMWSARATSRPVALRLSGPLDSTIFTADCRMAATIAGKEVRVWNAPTGTLAAQPLVHTSAVTNATFSANGARLVTVSATGARVWDLRTGVAAPERLLHGGDYERIAFSAGAGRVATVLGKELRVWDAGTGKPVGNPVPLDGEAGRLVMSPVGHRVLVTLDRGNGRVYSTDTGQKVGRAWKFDDSYDAIVEPVMSPDWLLITTVLSKAARVWSVDTGERVGKLLTHRDRITTVAFSHDGQRIVTGSNDATARIWVARTGDPVGNPMRHEQGLVSAVFSADGTRVVTVSNKLMAVGGDHVAPFPRYVGVWNAQTGQQVGTTIEHEEDVRAVAISPDGKRVLICNGNTASLWDPETGARVRDPLEFAAPVTSASYSLDGNRIVTVAGDTASLWDAVQLVPIGLPLKGSGTIASAGFLQDGQRLLMTIAAQEEPGSAATVCKGSCPPRAWLWDVPTGAPEDGPLLAAAAEIMSGYRITALGAVEAIGNRTTATDSLMRDLAGIDSPDSIAKRVTSWLFADPASRTGSPFGRPAVAPQVAGPPVRGRDSR